MGTNPLLSAVNLQKTYRRNADKVQVLRGLDLEVHQGEFLSVIGASGSGKSTMLHLFGTLDKPDDGSIHLDGRRIDNRPAQERDELRNRTFGFIFQFYHLLPELNTLENVLTPQIIQLLRDLNRQDGLTIVMVTHNLDIVHETDRVVRLVEGRVEKDKSDLLPFDRVVAAS